MNDERPTSANLLPDHSVVPAVWARFTDIDVERGEGSWLIARDGTRCHLDYTSGIGVANTGHAHPRGLRVPLFGAWDGSHYAAYAISDLVDGLVRFAQERY